MAAKLLYFCVFTLTVFSCNSSAKDVEFKGTWVADTVLDSLGSNEYVSADSLAKFPLIFIEKEKADSLLFYYNNQKRNVYPSNFVHNSYYIHFDLDNEYFLTIDYKTNELVFSNLKNNEFYRFRKIEKDLTSKEILSPDFDLEKVIHSVK